MAGRRSRQRRAASSGPRSSCRKWPPPRDRRVRLPARPGSRSLEDAIGAARDRVRVAERGEERLRPALEHRPTPRGSPPRRDRRAVAGTSSRELPRARLVALVGKRRVVGRRRPRASASRGTSAAARCRRRELRHLLRELPPGQERVGPGRRRRSAGTCWRRRTRAKRSGCSATSRRPIRPPQSWHTSVTSRRSSASSTAAHPVDVARVGVVLARGRLVGAAEADRSGATRAARRRRAPGSSCR